MSRVGKHPVPIPQGVTCQISGQEIKVKGKNGELSALASKEVQITQDENGILVRPSDESKQARMLWGTWKNRIKNMVQGVNEGFTVRLEINGVGYRAAVEGSNLKLQLGYSHDILYPIPQGIQIKCEKPTAIAISGADRQRIGQVAAEIRAYRKPEPYKGKGVKYENEHIVRKEGKKK
ncbi:MAG: 50S ribosomal protein L6 [Alphaproteobacteria bacterium 41-28]|nr:MAG: 50S ribosomal protein L6 [Alphaproteobacteria bacterium 41-28]